MYVDILLSEQTDSMKEQTKRTVRANYYPLHAAGRGV